MCYSCDNVILVLPRLPKLIVISGTNSVENHARKHIYLRYWSERGHSIQPATSAWWHAGENYSSSSTDKRPRLSAVMKMLWTPRRSVCVCCARSNDRQIRGCAAWHPPKITVTIPHTWSHFSFTVGPFLGTSETVAVIMWCQVIIKSGAWYTLIFSIHE